MKYMLIMRAHRRGLRDVMDADFNKMLENVGRFNEEMIRAGVLVAAEGLDDPAAGRGRRLLGPSRPWSPTARTGRPRSCSAGSTILDVASKEEAVEWAKRVADQRSRGLRPRSAGSPGSTSSRRTTSGSRRSGHGARRPASCERP